MIDTLTTSAWAGLISRTAGPLKFRFVLQPAIAIFLAVRCGLKDSREGKPAYFWALFTDTAHRRELLRDGWKSDGRIFLLAMALDCVYQLIVLRWIYPLDAVAVAVFLAMVPYLLVRGPVNRVATLRKKHEKAPEHKKAA